MFAGSYTREQIKETYNEYYDSEDRMDLTIERLSHKAKMSEVLKRATEEDKTVVEEDDEIYLVDSTITTERAKIFSCWGA